MTGKRVGGFDAGLQLEQSDPYRMAKGEVDWWGGVLKVGFTKHSNKGIRDHSSLDKTSLEFLPAEAIKGEESRWV